MDAYDLYITADERPAEAFQVGWIGTDGPGIDPREWPRSPISQLPMLHGFTLRLPTDYQRQGPEFPAIAFFQGEGEFSDVEITGDAASDDPFLRQVAEARPHPRLQLRTDILDQPFALIWLTAEEFAAGPTAPPPDVRREGEHELEDAKPSAWQTPVAYAPVFAAPRIGDPNVGKAPVEPGAAEPSDELYEEMLKPHGSYDPQDPRSIYKPWALALEGRDGHLGGTAFPYQALPEGLTPYYLEFWEFGGLNFGGGSAQLDLESEVFDWACG